VPVRIARFVVEEFYQALVSARAQRDVARFAPFLHDDVEWTINGPVEVLKFCGTRRGKVAVLDLIARVLPAAVTFTAFKREAFLVDGDRAAALVQLTGTRIGSGDAISYRMAQFMRFQDNQVIEFRTVIDSFDAAEQVLGRPIELMPAAPCGANVDVVTV